MPRLFLTALVALILVLLLGGQDCPAKQGIEQSGRLL